MTAQAWTSIRRHAAEGMTGPILFLAVLALLAVLHDRVEVSDHQVLRYGVLMYLGFFFYGALTVYFATGLRAVLRPGRAGIAAAWLVALFGCGPLLAVFTMDPGDGPPKTWYGILHFGGFLLVTLVPIFAMPVFGCRGSARFALERVRCVFTCHDRGQARRDSTAERARGGVRDLVRRGLDPRSCVGGYLAGGCGSPDVDARPRGGPFIR